MRTSTINSHNNAFALPFADWHYPVMTLNAYNPDAWRIAIRSFMDRSGLSNNSWAKVAGVSEGALRNFLSGRSNTISIETLEKLTAAVDKSHADFLSELFDTNKCHIPVDRIVHVPLLSWVEAGAFSEVVGTPPADVGDEGVAVVSSRETLIAVRIRGNSINRVAPDGSIAVIDYQDTDLVNGKLYGIMNGDNEGTVKRYFANPDRFEPDSTEPHQTIFAADHDIQVVGRVIQTTTET